jgi:hypothetical protein
MKTLHQLRDMEVFPGHMYMVCRALTSAQLCTNKFIISYVLHLPQTKGLTAVLLNYFFIIFNKFRNWVARNS